MSPPQNNVSKKTAGTWRHRSVPCPARRPGHAPPPAGSDFPPPDPAAGTSFRAAGGPGGTREPALRPMPGPAARAPPPRASVNRRWRTSCRPASRPDGCTIHPRSGLDPLPPSGLAYRADLERLTGPLLLGWTPDPVPFPWQPAPSACPYHTSGFGDMRIFHFNR